MMGGRKVADLGWEWVSMGKLFAEPTLALEVSPRVASAAVEPSLVI